MDRHWFNTETTFPQKLDTKMCSLFILENTICIKFALSFRADDVERVYCDIW